jgi:hypothetical protein
MNTLTFAFDVELDNNQFIEAGTVVEVYPFDQRKDSKAVIYKGKVIEFMNHAFIENMKGKIIE